VQEIMTAGEHLLELINEILDLSRIESGRLDLDIETVALESIIEKCVTQIMPLASSRSITIKLIQKLTYSVHADKRRLRQVLINLLSNAIKYNKDNGDINIYCTETSPRHVRINIQDTGRGITDDTKQSLFKPFERIESSYDGIEGTGIGLALAKQLVEGMHGEIGVESVYGTGSIFWFELPLSTSLLADSEPSIVNKTIPASSSGRHQKLLYVEDNPANFKVVKRFLNARKDFELLEAMSAKEGLEIIEQQHLDLILLDINLPDMDGFTILQQLRSNPETQSIPVFAITANAMLSDIEQGMQAGFDEYITKPIDIDNLLNKLDRYLL